MHVSNMYNNVTQNKHGTALFEVQFKFVKIKLILKNVK